MSAVGDIAVLSVFMITSTAHFPSLSIFILQLPVRSSQEHSVYACAHHSATLILQRFYTFYFTEEWDQFHAAGRFEEILLIVLHSALIQLPFYSKIKMKLVRGRADTHLGQPRFYSHFTPILLHSTAILQ